MKKVAAFVNVLRRFKIPIIVVVALLLATVAALLGTRGIVYDSVKCPPQIVYGESVDYKAGAFLGNVVYEYREDGSDVLDARNAQARGQIRRSRRVRAHVRRNELRQNLRV